jgi:hypothetical protein
MALSAVGSVPSVSVSNMTFQLDLAQYLSNVFDQINDATDPDDPTDSNPTDPQASSSITQAQFEASFNSLSLPPQLKALGADTVFGLLDPTGTGSVSKSDFVSGLTKVLDDVRAGRATRHSHVASTPSEASDDASQPSAWQLINQVLGANSPAPGNPTAPDSTSNAGDQQFWRNRLTL